MNLSRLKFFLRQFILFFVLLGISNFAANAGEYRLQPRAVAELFTSQGCSSCPLADKVLNNVANSNSDIITLAYHVDYWDYIGWRDTFGNAQNTKLQNDYSKALGITPQYTPQLIINGQEEIIGSHEAKITKALLNANLSIPVSLKVDEHYIKIKTPSDIDHDEAIVWLITFQSKSKIKILRGENRGKILTYSNIVSKRQAIGMLESKNGTEIKLPTADILTQNNNGFAIIVQTDINGLPGKILGSASYIIQ